MLQYIFYWFVWNVFLAVIPVGLAYTIRLLVNQDGTIRPMLRAPVLLLWLVWLAFLPNTCYLLTEWRHFLNVVEYGNLGTRMHADPAAVITLMQYTLFYLSLIHI